MHLEELLLGIALSLSQSVQDLRLVSFISYELRIRLLGKQVCGEWACNG
jgi:hypothetical protein